MLSEKNSEKVAVYVALIASILALIITIVNYFAPSGTLFAGSAGASAPAPVRRPGGGGGGRMMRGPAGTRNICGRVKSRSNFSISFAS